MSNFIRIPTSGVKFKKVPEITYQEFEHEGYIYHVYRNWEIRYMMAMYYNNKDWSLAVVNGESRAYKKRIPAKKAWPDN